MATDIDDAAIRQARAHMKRLGIAHVHLETVASLSEGYGMSAPYNVIVISGAVLAEMTDHQPTRLGPGGFAMMAGHMAHQFTCQSKFACLMIVTFDRAYDIYWGKGG